MLTIGAMSCIIPIAHLRNGGIAQLARACGSYPQCPRFESRCRYQTRRRYKPAPLLWPVGQAVKTPPFHGGNMGSIPVRVTTSSQAIQSLRRFFYAFIKKTFCADPAAYYLRLGRALLGSGVVLGLPSKSDEYSRILHV